MSTDLQTQPKNRLHTLVKSEGIQSRFREVLGQRAPQFISSLIQVGNSLGDDCDALSIISGAMTAASLDLPINKNLGFAWLVPFRDKGVKAAQFQMGYKGYIQLALRTGQYKRMNARPVNIECVGGFDDVGEQVIDWSKLDANKPAAGYAFAFQMVNGFTKVCYWCKADVENHAKQYSQSFRGGYNSPWKTHFDEMAVKTVIANELRRWGILSVEMQTAMERDGGVVRGVGNDSVEVTFPDNKTEAPEPTATIVQSAPAATQAPVEQDQVPGAEVPAEPAKAALPKLTVMPDTSAPAAKQQKEMLAEAIILAGYTFDDFKAWAEATGGIGDVSALGRFDEIHEATAKRLMRSVGSILKSIKDGKGAQ